MTQTGLELIIQLDWIHLMIMFQSPEYRDCRHEVPRPVHKDFLFLQNPNIIFKNKLLFMNFQAESWVIFIGPPTIAYS